MRGRQKKKTGLNTSLSRRSRSKRQHPFFTERTLYGLHHGDARDLAKRLPSKSIATTITSPPYFDLKDYGRKKQIGHGQSYQSYLKDLSLVFREIHRATRRDGSLWIVIDSFRRGQEVCPLPFDLASELKQAGWTLRDVIIWKKERTLPWIHEGKTKKIFEYVLVFAKAGEKFRYFPDKVRDHTGLRRWWVKYPERYNPSGKALEEIWNFDIPVQGSWNSTQIRHYCPLPAALIGRVIDLTTTAGDVVLDPFAGSGATLLEARARKRQSIGFEVNHNYIQRFKAFLRSSPPQSRSEKPNRGHSFRSLVLKLRLLKFGRLLYRKLSIQRQGRGIEKIFVRKLPAEHIAGHKLQAAEYVIYAPGLSDPRATLRAASAICSKRPLSKYGIEQSLRVVRSRGSIPRAYSSRSLFGYSTANSHKFQRKLTLAASLESSLPIVSPIAVRVEEPDD